MAHPTRAAQTATDWHACGSWLGDEGDQLENVARRKRLDSNGNFSLWTLECGSDQDKNKDASRQRKRLGYIERGRKMTKAWLSWTRPEKGGRKPKVKNGRSPCTNRGRPARLAWQTTMEGFDWVAGSANQRSIHTAEVKMCGD